MTGTTVTVTLTNYANNPVVAGTAWLQQVVGNGGGDDDFHVASTSPTIDAGNPAVRWGLNRRPTAAESISAATAARRRPHPASRRYCRSSPRALSTSCKPASRKP